MKKLLLSFPHFKNFDITDLDDFHITYFTLEKGETIFKIGQQTTKIGFVLSGSLSAEFYDLMGHKNIMKIIKAHESFGETYAITGEKILVNVMALEPSHIILVDIQSKMKNSLVSLKLTQNLMFILAKKNYYLSNKISHIADRSLRQRILTYLTYESKKHSTNTFQIPFNRQEMADYLNVDRSALSNELSKLKKENILDFHKNTFTIL